MPRGVKRITTQQTPKPKAFECEIKVICQKRLNDWVISELEIFRQWNPTKVDRVGNGYAALWLDGSWWKIFPKDKVIKCQSSERFVWIGRMIKINLKQGRIEVY